MDNSSDQTQISRKVSPLLGIGIALLPGIFVWFLLRKGHSERARLIGFGWAGLLIAFSSAISLVAPSGTSLPTSQPHNVAANDGEEEVRRSIADAPVEPAMPKRTDADRTEFQVASKMKMEEALRDPDSADYDDVSAHFIAKAGQSPDWAFCGKVNAKNGFGGYSGYQRFVANPLFAVIDDRTAEFATLWQSYCGTDTEDGSVWF